MRLWGRAFDGFRRAVRAHGSAEATWFGLPELQDKVLHGDPDADLLVVPADWLPALAASGRIVPLSSYVDSMDAWSQSFVDGVSWNGDVYGIPFHDGPQLLFTRPSLGLPVPSTWDEIAAQSASVGTVLAGAPDGHNNVYDFFLHLWRLDGDVRAALEFLRGFKAYAGADAHELDSNGSGERFAEGRAGLMVNWAGYAALAEGRVDFRCSLAPSTTVNAFWATVITSTCATPDRAWAYVEHASSAESDLRTTLAGASGARLSTWRDPRVLGAHPEYALFEAAHQNSRPLPRIPQLPALVDSLNDLVDAVVWREEPDESAVAAAQSTLEGLR